MLQAAGVTRVLVDYIDIVHLGEDRRWLTDVAIDSATYKFRKDQQKQHELPAYRTLVHDEAASGLPVRWASQIDIWQEPMLTMRNWREVRAFGDTNPPFLPIWPWGSPLGMLHEMLDTAPIVGIGGLVPMMRAKDETMYAGLGELLDRWPQRLHIFGANWLKVIQTYNHRAASLDTSKFLDGGRYGHIIYIDSRNQMLRQAPARAESLLRSLGLDASYAASGRTPEGRRGRFLRCTHNAEVLNALCNAH